MTAVGTGGMMPGSVPPDIVAAVYDSFIADLHALKPGNVSRYAGGHGMDYGDFVKSATAVTPILCRSGMAVGERILAAVRVTRATVRCNTNLGMLLLFAPLIRAWERLGQDENLEQSLKHVLEHLDQSDAKNVFDAIRLANPGGLGQAEKFDLHSEVQVGLREAMAEAGSRDLIALQYSNGFEELFRIGLPVLRAYAERWKNLEWATVGCYLTFLSRFPDTHISRKFGSDKAREIMHKTREIWQAFDNNDNPEGMRDMLLDYDRELKNTNINPGTSADMTAASVLLFRLTA
jgi:triphosphoribosyl-dephospho-CoA synthase